MITASDNDDNVPMNVDDGDLNTRWSANGNGQWIQYDLGTTASFSGLGISWYKGDSRISTFDIQVSKDGVNWITALYQQTSSGSTTEIEDYTFPSGSVSMRYVRVVGYGNSYNSWNSISEIQVLYCNEFGCEPQCTDDYPRCVNLVPCNLDPNCSACDIDPSSPECLCQLDPTKCGACDLHPTGRECFCKNNPDHSDCTCDRNDPLCVWWPIPIPVPDMPDQPTPDLPPYGNFDLGDWYVSVPSDIDGNGKPDDIKEEFLWDGYEDPEFFYIAPDGGLVMTCPITGQQTPNTKYTRVELREMLRRGQKGNVPEPIGTSGVNKNNWVLSTASAANQAEAGGVDGSLRATLKVDHVTTTGDSSQVGRVIVGQIHSTNDEPARLYYRKLPGNSKGSIYLAHEPLSGSEQWYDIIGSGSSTASDPADGIALGEVFSYEILASGYDLLVTISREGKPDVVQYVDMSNSGFDGDDEYLYFKAGVYNQNNSGDDNDYVQATFYSIKNSHGNYAFSE